MCPSSSVLLLLLTPTAAAVHTSRISPLCRRLHGWDGHSEWHGVPSRQPVAMPPPEVVRHPNARPAHAPARIVPRAAARASPRMRTLLATPTMTLAIAGALRRLLPTVALSLFTLISLFVYELSRSARPTAASNVLPAR